jgi:hypothetical protein
MTTKVSLLLDAQGGKAAKAEIDALTSSVRKAGDAAQDTGRKTAEGARAVEIAQRSAATSTTQLARSQTLAAGATGNLVAQFNDIGMMLAAGQNPLQLAIQQGTQITQVIGPMGAAGAARALGSAFIGMLSPINLITVGVIAVGATMIQWLTSAGEEAVSLEDQIEGLADALSALKSAQDRLSEPFEALRDVFGEQTAAAREFLEIQRNIAAAQTQMAISDATSGFADQFGKFSDTTREGLAPVFDELNRLNAEATRLRTEIATAGSAETLGLNRSLLQVEDQLTVLEVYETSLSDLMTKFDLTRPAAEQLAMAISDVGNAVGPEAQAEAAQELARQINIATDGLSSADGATNDLYQSLLDIVIKGMEFAALDLAEPLDEAADAGLRLSSAASVVAGELYDAQTALGLLAAMEPAEGWLSGAVSMAAALAGNLWDAVNAYNTFATSTPAAMGPAGAPISGVPQAGPDDGEWSGPTPPTRPFELGLTDLTPSGGARGGGGGGDPAEEAARLMEQLQDRTDALLGRLDPLVAATQEYEEAQNTLNDAWEAGIITADEHAAAMAKVSEEYAASRAEASGAAQAWQFVGQTGNDVLMDIAAGAMSLEEAALKAAAALAQAVLQGALLGEGPFGDLFGGSSIVEMIVGSINGGTAAPALPGKAGGGMITGPGTGTSDDVLMWGSNGEFVVTAAATARYRPMLEAMNAGSPLPGFARGGMIGGGAGGGGAALGGNTLNATFDLRGARGNAEIEEAAYRGMNRALAEFKAYDLPIAVRAINSDPTRIG